MDYQAFSPSEFDAARFFVARLASENEGRQFTPDEIGLSWSPLDPVLAFTEDGAHPLHATDFVRSALIIIWSLISEMANASGQDTSQVLSGLGIGVAAAEPSGLPDL
jgi:hypothetical protein